MDNRNRKSEGTYFREQVQKISIDMLKEDHNKPEFILEHEGESSFVLLQKQNTFLNDPDTT